MTYSRRTLALLLPAIATCRAFSISLRVWQLAVVCVEGRSGLLWRGHGSCSMAFASKRGLGVVLSLLSR